MHRKIPGDDLDRPWGVREAGRLSGTGVQLPLPAEGRAGKAKRWRERILKRVLLIGILLCFVTLGWILYPTPDVLTQVVSPPNRFWTERTTKYPRREFSFPPSSQLVKLPRLSQDPNVMKHLDEEWRGFLSNASIVGIDFEFNNGFSEKFRVVFDTGHVAMAKPFLSAEEYEVGAYAQVQTVDFDE